jgi:hypothetical protein
VVLVILSIVLLLLCHERNMAGNTRTKKSAESNSYVHTNNCEGELLVVVFVNPFGHVMIREFVCRFNVKGICSEGFSLIFR